MSGCSSLTILPSSFGSLSSLQKLYVSRTHKLTSSLDECSRLSSLNHHLEAGCLALAKLPPNFGSLSSLTTLRLNFSSVKSLPESISGFYCLQKLFLTECLDLKHLPDTFSNLSRLKHLDLTSCFRLARLPDTCDLPDLRVLELSFVYSLTSLPSRIGCLSSLRHLNLKFCTKITELPQSFTGLSKLQHLNLRECWRLRSLPGSIACLNSLTEMNLTCCDALTSLPDDIGSLSNLSILMLSRCKMPSLPPSFSAFIGCRMQLMVFTCDSRTVLTREEAAAVTRTACRGESPSAICTCNPREDPMDRVPFQSIARTLSGCP